MRRREYLDLQRAQKSVALVSLGARDRPAGKTEEPWRRWADSNRCGSRRHDLLIGEPFSDLSALPARLPRRRLLRRPEQGKQHHACRQGLVGDGHRFHGSPVRRVRQLPLQRAADDSVSGRTPPLSCSDGVVCFAGRGSSWDVTIESLMSSGVANCFPCGAPARRHLVFPCEYLDLRSHLLMIRIVARRIGRKSAFVARSDAPRRADPRRNDQPEAETAGSTELKD